MYSAHFWRLSAHLLSPRAMGNDTALCAEMAVLSRLGDRHGEGVASGDNVASSSSRHNDTIMTMPSASPRLSFVRVRLSRRASLLRQYLYLPARKYPVFLFDAAWRNCEKGGIREGS